LNFSFKFPAKGQEECRRNRDAVAARPYMVSVKLSSAAAVADGAAAFVNSLLHRNTLRYASGSQWHLARMMGCHLILQRHKSSRKYSWLADEAFQDPYF
jgi:hypothetical protein